VLELVDELGVARAGRDVRDHRRERHGRRPAADQRDNDFTAPVIYRVTADDGSTQDYTVTVVTTASPAKDLSALSFEAAHNPGLPADVAATIVGNTVMATMPFGAPVATLVATFTTTGASVAAGRAVHRRSIAIAAAQRQHVAGPACEDACAPSSDGHADRLRGEPPTTDQPKP
jgi:hypothetical protein